MVCQSTLHLASCLPYILHIIPDCAEMWLSTSLRFWFERDSDYPENAGFSLARMAVE